MMTRTFFDDEDDDLFKEYYWLFTELENKVYCMFYNGCFLSGMTLIDVIDLCKTPQIFRECDGDGDRFIDDHNEIFWNTYSVIANFASLNDYKAFVIFLSKRDGGGCSCKLMKN